MLFYGEFNFVIKAPECQYSEATLIQTLDIWMPQLYEQFGQDKIYQINAFLLQI